MDPGQAAVLEEEDLAQDREAADPAAVGRELLDSGQVRAVEVSPSKDQGRQP